MKIDNRMAVQAVEQGSRVGIVATVATTLDPTERLIQRKATEAGKSITTKRYLVNSAFDALLSGKIDEHDRLLKAESEKAMGENDVVVLAQGSMARLVPSLEQRVPVLSSPRSSVEALKAQLGI